MSPFPFLQNPGTVFQDVPQHALDVAGREFEEDGELDPRRPADPQVAHAVPALELRIRALDPGPLVVQRSELLRCLPAQPLREDDLLGGRGELAVPVSPGLRRAGGLI